MIEAVTLVAAEWQALAAAYLTTWLLVFAGPFALVRIVRRTARRWGPWRDVPVQTASTPSGRRPVRPPDRLWSRAVTVLAAVVVAADALLLLGGLARDQLEATDPARRPELSRAVHGTAECSLPFSRVRSSQARADGSVRFTCGITPVGWPRFTGWVQYGDGHWWTAHGTGAPAGSSPAAPS
jgi:hypothetical protein